MMKKENKSKEYVIQSFKKVWARVDKAQEMMIKIGMMKTFDQYNIVLFEKLFYFNSILILYISKMYISRKSRRISKNRISNRS
jgi:hypothetical protein